MEGLNALPWLLALTLGLAGGAHCALMCGPLCAACAHRPDQASLPRLLSLQSGRLLGYALLGLLAGSGGALFRLALGEPLWLLARLLAALSLLVAGAVLLGWRGPERLAQRALPWWQRQVATRVARWVPNGMLASVLLGSAWALLPCGLLYAALLLTASQNGPAQGAVAMLAFGVGTLPATLASALGLLRLRRQGRQTRWARPAGALLAGLGLFALLAPWLLGHHWLGPAAAVLLDCTVPG